MEQLSRREFLRKGAAGAAALAVSGLAGELFAENARASSTQPDYRYGDFYLNDGPGQAVVVRRKFPLQFVSREPVAMLHAYSAFPENPLFPVMPNSYRAGQQIAPARPLAQSNGDVITSEAQAESELHSMLIRRNLDVQKAKVLPVDALVRLDDGRFMIIDVYLEGNHASAHAARRNAKMFGGFSDVSHVVVGVPSGQPVDNYRREMNARINSVVGSPVDFAESPLQVVLSTQYVIPAQQLRQSCAPAVPGTLPGLPRSRNCNDQDFLYVPGEKPFASYCKDIVGIWRAHFERSGLLIQTLPSYRGAFQPRVPYVCR